MGRKKKTTIKKQESDSALKYSGEVTVSLIKDNKVYSTKTFKNSGRTPLFKFLATCLAGGVSESMYSRPQYIEFFHVGNYEGELPTGSFSQLASSSSVRTYSPVLYSGAINVEATDPQANDEGSASATFKFLVGMSNINYAKGPTGSGDDGSINMFALYSTPNKPVRDGSQNDFTKASAFVILKKDSSQPGQTEKVLDRLIEPQDAISTELDKYNVLIQWKMTLKN